MLRERFAVSERRVCRLLGHPRGTQRYTPTQRSDEAPLTQAIIGLACGTGAFVVLSVRQHWVTETVREQRFLAERIATELGTER